jgi:hypothetical protein
MSDVIVRTALVTSILPVGGEIVHTLYVFDTHNRCYVYQTVLTSYAAAGKLIDDTIGADPECLHWSKWKYYSGNPVAA